MTDKVAADDVLAEFWQLAQAVAPRSPAVAQPDSATDDGDWDFLSPPAPRPEAPTAAHAALDPERLAAFGPLRRRLPALAAALGPEMATLGDDGRLDRLDGAAAVVLCEALTLGEMVRLPEHGALVRLLQRAAAAEAPESVIAAAHAIAHLEARAAQLPLVARLRRGPAGLGHEGTDAILGCLKVVADGRCVREMEALLVERGAELSDAHAWQARHIVQVIRRAGRK